MNQIMAPGDRIFGAFLGDMRNFTDPKYLDDLEKIPRGDVRSVDYHHTLKLDFFNRQATSTLVTRRGWIFISTSILVQDRQSLTYPTLVKIRQAEVSSGGLSGGPSSAQPPEIAQDRGWLSSVNGFGPGNEQAENHIWTEPRSFFRYWGDSALIEADAKFSTYDGIDRTVDIIVTGWEVRNVG
jgi:hypothetical protein